MKYGCIGERLGHSFSKEIHSLLADYPYELYELAPEELDEFARAKNFTAINVTIPYKEKIIPHLFEIDAHARAIGAVNTVVNRGGKLYGYNTDFYGMEQLLRHANVEIRGKKVVILGTGGTAKTAMAVCKAHGAASAISVSRTKKEGCIDYGELYSGHTDAEVIINTTPVGMFPSGDSEPTDIRRFPRLSGVIDAIYNPLRTKIVRAANARGIAAEGGLYMLVAQAVRASEIFLDTKYPEGTVDRVYGKILAEKENIVLIGMPSSGKTTVGKILAHKSAKKLIDTDEEIKAREKREISEIFEKYGEAGFRSIESRVIADASSQSGVILATGGGAVLSEDNIDRLRANGKIYFLDRPLCLLAPTLDRPLTSSRDALEKKYKERYPLYLSSCDVRIISDGTAEDTANKILGGQNEDIRN